MAAGVFLSSSGVDAIWNETLAGHSVADSTGLLLKEWQDGERLDAILDIIAADVVNIDGQAMRGTDSVDTATMRGTDDAALATVASETRLAELDSGNLPADTDAILAAIRAANIRKNVAINDIPMLMTLSSDNVTAATGLSPVLTVSIDGGAFGAKDGSTTVIEIAGTGIYVIDAAQADTNGDVVTWKLSVATADDAEFTFKTIP
jgi:hypothetical protein